MIVYLSTADGNPSVGLTHYVQYKYPAEFYAYEVI